MATLKLEETQTLGQSWFESLKSRLNNSARSGFYEFKAVVDTEELEQYDPVELQKLIMGGLTVGYEFSKFDDKTNTVHYKATVYPF